MKLELVNYKKEEKQGATAEKLIYEIGNYEVVVTKLNGNTVQIWVNKNSDDRYVPSITCYEYDPWGYDRQFMIQTTSFGALKIDEYAKLMTAMQEAAEVVKVLNANFCN